MLSAFLIGMYLAAKKTKSGFLVTTSSKSERDSQIVSRAVFSVLLIDSKTSIHDEFKPKPVSFNAVLTVVIISIFISCNQVV